MNEPDATALYELYVAFQSQLQHFAERVCRSAAAREHYRRVLRPAPRELFEARLENMTGRERRHQVTVWCAGFSAWVRKEVQEELSSAPVE